MAQRPAPYRTPSRTPSTTRSRVPTELSRPIATTNDGRDITRPWRTELEEARDPRLAESIDWGVYDRIAQDPEVRSTFQQRRRAVTSADWDVLPGDGEDPRSVEAAEQLKANLEEVGLDATTEKMLKAVMNGNAVAELMWGPWNGLIGFVPTDRCRPIHVRHARRFRKDRDARIRLLTTASGRGEIVPDRKFWWVTFGADDDDDFYGRGLAADLYWPVLMKRNGFGFWNIALDKFGSPTAMGTYNRGATQADIDKLLQSLEAIANDSGFVIPEGMKVELLQAAMSGNAGHESLIRICDEYIDKVILSQTMTTADGSSNAQAQVHAGVKKEVVTGDADLICESFNEGPARWWTDYNYGADVASPVLVRLLDEEEDLEARAKTDETLDRIGWVRTEESFKDTYGDGYERKAAPKSPIPDRATVADPVAVDAGADTTGRPAAEDESNVIPFRATSFAAFDPRPLYVHRQLRNTADLLAWARAAGFTTPVDADTLHVTVAYSRQPVDWFAMGGGYGPASGELTVAEGGPRAVQALGRDGAVVLLFASPELDWRHREMRDAGASWDHEGYSPHVTFTYAAGDVDLAAVEPYRGTLVFGPELFESLDNDWTPGTSFAENGAPDIVDQAVAALIAGDGYTALSPLMAPIADAIASSGSPDELDAALIASLAQSDVDRLTDALTRAGFALRVAGEVGADET